jgi:hypothetical protein
MSEINSSTDVDDADVVDMSREAFDNWYSGRIDIFASFKIDEDGYYKDSAEQVAWRGWQACAQLKQTEIEQLRAEFEDRAPAVADVTIGQAMRRLKQAMKDEPDCAYGFHSNIAMMCYDSIREAAENVPHEQALLIGNDAASRFMKIAFDAKTSHDMLLKEPKP